MHPHIVHYRHHQVLRVRTRLQQVLRNRGKYRLTTVLQLLAQFQLEPSAVHPVYVIVMIKATKDQLHRIEIADNVPVTPLLQVSDGLQQLLTPSHYLSYILQYLQCPRRQRLPPCLYCRLYPAGQQNDEVLRRGPPQSDRPCSQPASHSLLKAVHKVDQPGSEHQPHVLLYVSSHPLKDVVKEDLLAVLHQSLGVADQYDDGGVTLLDGPVQLTEFYVLLDDGLLIQPLQPYLLTYLPGQFLNKLHLSPMKRAVHTHYLHSLVIPQRPVQQ